MPLTNWTLEDLVAMTQLAAELALQHDVYCEWCGVIPVTKDGKYCLQCTAELVDDLAKEYEQQMLVDGGLY